MNPRHHWSSMCAAGHLAPVILVLAGWVWTHPYHGIWHDARVYAVQALYHLQPAVYGHDLFFLFGSQDAFTVFTRLYAALIAAFGLNTAAILALVAGQGLWIAAAAAALRRLVPANTFWPALLLVAVMPAGYSALQIVSYGEPFLTARLYAEGFSLLSLAALLSGRVVSAFAIALAAAALHPLTTLPVLVLMVCHLALRDRRWLIAPAFGIAALAGLALAGVAPFDRLLDTMDSRWLSVIHRENRIVFLENWYYADWSRIFFDATAVGLAACLAGGQRLRRLMGAALITAATGLLVSWVGADLMHNTLITQLQTWRALWLLHLLAYVSIAVLAVALRDSPNRALLASLTACAWLTIPLLVSPPLVVIAALLVIAESRHRLPAFSVPARWTTFGITAAAAAVVLVQRAAHPFHHAPPGESSAFTDNLLITLRFGPVFLGLAALAAWLIKRRAHPRPLLAATLAGLTLAGGVAVWDQRTHWERFVETADRARVPFAAEIPPSANVYWEDDLRATWLLLRRASYVSAMQAGGAVFSRRTALEYEKRRAQLRPLGAGDIPFGPNDRTGSAYSPPTPTLIRSICNGAHALDFLVLSQGLDHLYTDRWIPPYPTLQYHFSYFRRVAQPVRTYYLYKCELIRSMDSSNADQ